MIKILLLRNFRPPSPLPPQNDFFFRYRDPTPQIEAEALKENRELLEQAEKNMNQKSNRTTCGNAAAGLIVLPTRVNANASQVNSTGGTSQSSGTSSINGENT
ncbi:unnamed protein product, partial [Trichobilharzia regenti]